MPALHVFNSVSLDGYFTDANGDMSWAHRNDPEWTEFTNSNAQGGVTMLFGRITYEMMQSFWPTAAAEQAMPKVAKVMNSALKIVFSRTLNEATWQHSRIVKDDIVEAVRNLKSEPGPDLLLMGSGSIISQLTAARLVDGYQLVTVPVVLGAGRSMFAGVPDKLELSTKESRRFGNGNVVTSYELNAS